MNQFQFFYRVVYGIQKAYPANVVAENFAGLMCVKTFSADQIRQIANLGFEVEVVRDPKQPAWERADLVKAGLA